MRLQVLLLGFISLFMTNLIFAEFGYKIVTEEYPPFSYTQDGKVVGISTEVVKEVVKRLGWKNTKIKVLPWETATQLAKNDPKTIIYSLTRIPERENKYKWAGPIATNYWNLYSLSKIDGKDLNFQILTLNDAKLFSLASQKEGAFSQFLVDKGFTHIQYTKNLGEALKHLLDFQAQILPASELPLYVLLKKQNIDKKQIKLILKVKTSNLYIGFNKNTPDSLIKKFNDVLKEIKQDGTYDKITNKYYEIFLKQWNQQTREQRTGDGRLETGNWKIDARGLSS